MCWNSHVFNKEITFAGMYRANIKAVIWLCWDLCFECEQIDVFGLKHWLFGLMFVVFELMCFTRHVIIHMYYKFIFVPYCIWHGCFCILKRVELAQHESFATPILVASLILCLSCFVVICLYFFLLCQITFCMLRTCWLCESLFQYNSLHFILF